MPKEKDTNLEFNQRIIDFDWKNSSIWPVDRSFPFQPLAGNFSMQMCNTVDNGLSSLTAAGVKACTNSNSSAAFSINEDSNGLKDINKKSTRDPLSHRIIEKRRRDRMNKCLSDLSRLIPPHYIKKGRGRIEKTEIVEMAIKHIKNLEQLQQNNNNNLKMDLTDNNQYAKNNLQSDNQNLSRSTSKPFHHLVDKNNNGICRTDGAHDSTDSESVWQYKFQLGYQECISETMRFLTEIESILPNSKLCINLVNHLSKNLDLIVKNRCKNNLDAECKHKISSVEKIQIKLEEMDVDELNQSTMNRSPKCTSLNDSLCNVWNNNTTSTSFANNSRISPILEHTSTNGSNLAKHSSPSTSNTLRNILVKSNIGTKTELDHDESDCVLNQSSAILKSRSLTSSPNSASSDCTLYKFKKNIKERFQADLQSKREPNFDCNGSLRPRSATIGANILTRRPELAECREKLSSSSRELNASINQRDVLFPLPVHLSVPTSNCTPVQSPFSGSHQFDDNLLLKGIAPGFVLHPNGAYYVPIELDLTAIMHHFHKTDAQLLMAANMANLSPNGKLAYQVSGSTSVPCISTSNTSTCCSASSNANVTVAPTLSSSSNCSSFSSTSSSTSTFSSPFSALNLITGSNRKTLPSCNPPDKTTINVTDNDPIQNTPSVLHPVSIAVNFAFRSLPFNAYALHNSRIFV